MAVDQQENTTIHRQKRLLAIAGVLLLVQGIFMEAIVAIGAAVLLLIGVSQSVITNHAHIFALPYLQDNLYLMMIMSGIFAALRITGAVGLLRNRQWGLALSLINCVVTLVLMVFVLPAGIADGILSGAALILMLHAWFGNAVITGPRSHRAIFHEDK